MKTFTAFLLLSAFATYVSASEMEFHGAVFDFLDERHDERMAQVLREQGLPESTLVTRDHGKEIPAWMKLCKSKGELCWHQAKQDACKRLECIDNFIKCVKERHPTPLPSPSPIQIGCVALLKMCREHSPSCAGNIYKLCCFVRIKRCFAFAEEQIKKE